MYFVRSGVARRLLNELHAGGEAEFGVDVGEVVCTVSRPDRRWHAVKATIGTTAPSVELAHVVHAVSLSPGQTYWLRDRASVESRGMGEVYLAKHPRLPRRDALKVLSAAPSGTRIQLSDSRTAESDGNNFS